MAGQFPFIILFLPKLATAWKGESMSILRVILVATLCLSAFAQEPAKPRVFITNSYLWEILSNLGTSRDIDLTSRRRGNDLPISRIVNGFRDKCPGFTVTSNKEKADYVLVMEMKEGDTSPLSYVILDKEGDTFGSGSTTLMGTAMKEACKMLEKAQESLAGKNRNQ
jgi:hypothetical protein